jgi:hypothetical protein
MKQNALVVFFSFLFLFSSKAQELGVDIFPAAGGSAQSNQGIYASWTIGDIVIGEEKNSRKWLLQGFQQGILDTLRPKGDIDTLPPLTNIETGKEDIFVVSIYPNPVRNELHYKILSSEIFLFDISLIDFSGKIIWTKKNQKGENDYVELMNNLPNGIYFLRIYLPHHKIQKTYKIIKQ